MKMWLLSFVFALAGSADATIAVQVVTAIVRDAKGQYAKTDTIPYPDPKPGYRVVIIRPQYDNKSLLAAVPKKVELFFSKAMQTDMCNSVGGQGTLEKKPVPAAEYLNFYELKLDNHYISTLMGCGDRGTRVRLVSLYQNSGLLDFSDTYVLYVPIEVEVSYRVWQPGAVVRGGE